MDGQAIWFCGAAFATLSSLDEGRRHSLPQRGAQGAKIISIKKVKKTTLH